MEKQSKVEKRGVEKRFGSRIPAMLLAAVILITSVGAGLAGALHFTAVDAGAASKKKVVVLDPGHGGMETGAVYYGMMEKTLNLKIAKYCRAELNRYANVKVVLTRSTDRALSTKGTTPDLKARAKVSKKNKADLFVCLHNNAYGPGESTKTNGVRVYYQNNSFYKSVGKKSGQLANKIAGKVAACGLKNGGTRIRNSTSRERRDKKGKNGDYYGVLFYNKQYKVPAVLVEHAFMSNPGDAAKLKQEAFLKKLGQADAAAIAEYLGLKKKW